MIPEQIIEQWSEETGAICFKITDSKGVVGLIPYAYTWAICCNLDRTGMGFRYCYEDLTEALVAFKNWKGDAHPPGNWVKRKGFGEDLPNPYFINHDESKKERPIHQFLRL